jgi:methionine-S-sulfoxide reductase
MTRRKLCLLGAAVCLAAMDGRWHWAMGRLLGPAGDFHARTAAAAEPRTETAVLAGGCFWCIELSFEQLAGVIDVESGYCGGTKESANYEQVKRGTTGHAEAIRVTFDPEKISYSKLLDVFFSAHDPTQLNRQGNDIGRQYRSAIFFANPEQKRLAEEKIAELERKRVHNKRIVTKLEPLTEFYIAELYHQDFARRNPWVPYIQGHAVPKAKEVRGKHPELLRKGN